MWVVCLILLIISLLLLFLYIQLRKENKSFYDQLRYSREEDSSFTFFTTSSDDVMKNIIEEVNILKANLQQTKAKYMYNEHEIRDMIANISHDIRTPLTSIQGYVEMMQMSENIEERMNYYEIVRHRLDDLETMLDEFFLYTKLMSNSETLELESKEVYPLVCGSLLSYMDLLNSHDLQPMVVCEDEAITAQLHEDSFRRICMNLIMNTVRYGQNPFRITISKQGEYIQIVFENAVISTDVDVEHMFDRFYKGSRARTQNGSGLGLSIVKELCERMQGTVHAQYKKDMLNIILNFHIGTQ